MKDIFIEVISYEFMREDLFEVWGKYMMGAQKRR